jgi:Leucine-rich repeat (LRR) protein
VLDCDRQPAEFLECRENYIL